MRLVLASQSAVRQKLLAAAGVVAATDPAAIDESDIKRRSRADQESADACALTLAEAKAALVSRRQDGLVIGADQILECDGAWFDKPRDLVEARQQLLVLRGRAHELVSAVAVAQNGRPLWRHVERARLIVRNFSDAFLDAYVQEMGLRLCDTLGDYALEGIGAQLFARVEGDYFAILGLPLLPLLDFLRDEGALSR
jgi:septum formation protein